LVLSYIDQLAASHGIRFDEPWDYVTAFEEKIAAFCKSPHAIAADSCTHAMEACLRVLGVHKVELPAHSYVSVPQMLLKTGVAFRWHDRPWMRRYWLEGSPVIDGAVAFAEGCYEPGSMFCLSFQAKKRLALGRGGMILTDDAALAEKVRRLICDGRTMPSNWRSNYAEIGLGCHYHMVPDVAALGLLKLLSGDIAPWREIGSEEYPDNRHCAFAKEIA
jgi:dTDP-4-amino-4,6-dideoxygalactose transaminase